MIMPTVFLLPAMLLSALVAAGGLDLKKDCQESCGGVVIPYPFGIGTGCFRPGFEILCSSNTSYLAGKTLSVGIRVLSLSVMPRPEARVLLPVAFQCFTSTNQRTGYSYGDVDFNPVGVYRISNTRNELFVLGCNTLVYISSGPTGRFKYSYYAGCVAYCNDSRSAQDGACAGIGCCHVDFPPGLTGNSMHLEESVKNWRHVDQDFSPCDYAFIAEKGSYQFKVDDLTKMPTTHVMPMMLDWAIRDSDIQSTGSMYSCARVVSRTGYTCVSQNSECVDSTNGPGYFCNCTTGYEGNPYLLQGCKNINECTRPEEFPCNGECHDTEGSYSCSCRCGYHSDGDPKESPCNPQFSRIAMLVLGLTLGALLMTVATFTIVIKLERSKRKELFRKNGGKALQDVTGLIIFTKGELKKITDNDSNFLGKGRFGNVYKGTLSDNRIVAVKASIKVSKETKEEFTEEVKIQTIMIHKNILKLIGCCLEVDVPKLVYEFAANGSLEDTLYGRKRPLSIKLRLDIAIGSAEGLKYMHSDAPLVIRHGDVKPGNIFLDENFSPKLSDFGLSKLLTPEYCIVDSVVGPLPYIDPEYMKTGRLTQKSDVYGFGAVLVELVTREQNDNDQERIKRFCTLYTEQGSARPMFDNEIETDQDIFILEQIGKLATECLAEDIQVRPYMTEVVERLVMLRRDMKHGYARDTSESPSASVSAPATPDWYRHSLTERLVVSSSSVRS